MRRQLIATTLVTFASGCFAAPLPVRTPIASFPIEPAKPVTRVEAMRVDFLPGEVMPEHMHPVPVVCFVVKGKFLVSIGSSPVREVRVGDATVEHAGEIVHYFRNQSKIEPARLDCAVLAGPDDRLLSIMRR